VLDNTDSAHAGDLLAWAVFFQTKLI